MNETIKDKVVVITGASSGLGEATARHLAARGARLVPGARRLDRLQALAVELGLGPEAAVQTDVTDSHQVERLVSTAIALHGRHAARASPAPFQERHGSPVGHPPSL